MIVDTVQTTFSVFRTPLKKCLVCWKQQKNHLSIQDLFTRINMYVCSTVQSVVVLVIMYRLYNIRSTRTSTKQLRESFWSVRYGHDSLSTANRAILEERHVYRRNS